MFVRVSLGRETERACIARADGVVHCRADREGSAWRAVADLKQRGDFGPEDVLGHPIVFDVRTSNVGLLSQRSRWRRPSLLRADGDDRHEPVVDDRPASVEHGRRSD
jgi:hypothetical protein